MILTVMRNLGVFANPKTLLVSFFIEPLFTVLFFSFLRTNFLEASALQSFIALSIEMQVVAILAQILVGALVDGLLLDFYLSFRSLVYLIGIMVGVSFFVILLQSLAFVVLFGITGELWIQSWPTFLLGMGQAMLFAELLGLIVSFLSITRPNPYFFSNLLIGLLPVISVAIAPIRFYPDWLAMFSRIFPFWLVQSTLANERGGLLLSFLYGLIDLAVFIVVLKVSKRKMLKSRIS
ncbi:hypothetical protein LQZ24_05555 [Fructobacillus sp. M1-13]|uniref:Uncharacterized protein n=1 Tax=Fructobacillus papyriferae TaxID=2713171 RepID=A0ABS5QPF2_9LACO|nr:hypothetical protein [Fructobacillus papyriferae]MBS9335053.1 hypothetical protein [Fructobacillus papyriferae]MCD2159461.1 hypothetical protein [Fructobacillus papyriferae]